MEALNLEYLRELKKNIKLTRQNDVLKSLKKKSNVRENINTKFNKELQYIKDNIEKWSQGVHNNEIYTTLKNIIKINPIIQGAGLAFDQNIYKGKEGTTFYEDYHLYAPFVYQDPKTKEFYEYDIADYDYTTVGVKWWDTSKKTLQPHVTEPYRGRMSNTKTITHSFPIFVKNRYYGVVFYDVSWDHLNFICGFT